LRKYHFELIRSTIPEYKELAHIIHASSLADAVQKFTRKHRLDAPAYWDEPAFDTFMEMIFKDNRGSVSYKISW